MIRIGSIVFLIALVIVIVRSLKSRKTGRPYVPPYEPNVSYEVSLKCPNCGKDMGKAVEVYGSPFRKCPYCGKESYNPHYHELALISGAANSSYIYEAGVYEYELRASQGRLSSPGYAAKLYGSLKSAEPGCIDKLKEYTIPFMQRYTKILSEKIGMPYREYVVKSSAGLFDRLTYEAHDAAAVRQVTEEVLRHYGIDPKAYRINVDYDSSPSGKENGTRGSFTRGTLTGGTIRIVIEPGHSEYDTVIAIILHECAHAFLSLRGICLDDPHENECLTDAAAIYLGGARYILRGYFASSAYQLGYLKEIECEAVRTLTEQLEITMRQGILAEKQRLLTAWRKQFHALKTLIHAVDQSKSTLHPAAVLRESSVRDELYKLWQESEGLLSQAESLVQEIKDGENAAVQALNYALKQSETLTPRLDKFLKTLNEWHEAADQQANLPSSVLDSARGVEALAENGNAFAMLERIRLWSACPATQRDAGNCFHKLLLEEPTANGYCALGICHLEGLSVPKDMKAAESYLTRAASMGSPDAARLLREHAFTE